MMAETYTSVMAQAKEEYHMQVHPPKTDAFLYGPPRKVACRWSKECRHPCLPAEIIMSACAG